MNKREAPPTAAVLEGVPVTDGASANRRVPARVRDVAPPAVSPATEPVDDPDGSAGMEALLGGVLRMVMQHAAQDPKVRKQLGLDPAPDDGPPAPASEPPEPSSAGRGARSPAGNDAPAPRPVSYPVTDEEFEDAILNLYGSGLTVTEIRRHLANSYGVEMSRDQIATVIDRVGEEFVTWQSRPLDVVYPVLLVDAIYIKIKEGQVANRPVYVALGMNCAGERDVLGIWVGSGGEGAKQWMTYLSELKNRGVADVCVACCDGLKGLPEVIKEIWPLAMVQQCVVHLVRSSLRYASKADWSDLTPRLRDMYTAPTVDAAEAEFADFVDTWGAQYPAIVKLWRDSWEQFVPFLQYPPEIRRIIYSTNMIESLNARIRRITKRRAYFPNEIDALRLIYLVINQPEKGKINVAGRMYGWKRLANVLSLHFPGRIIIPG